MIQALVGPCRRRSWSSRWVSRWPHTPVAALRAVGELRGRPAAGPPVPQRPEQEVVSRDAAVAAVRLDEEVRALGALAGEQRAPVVVRREVVASEEPPVAPPGRQEEADAQ